MLKEVVELIQKTAVEAAEASVVALPNDPERVIVSQAGTHVIIDVPRLPPPRDHKVRTIADLVAAFDEFADSTVPGSRCVWHDADKVCFFADEPHRRSKVTLPLRWSEQWALLKAFAKPQALDQRTFVRQLRHDFAGGVDPGVLAAFRTVNFDVVSRAASKIEHGHRQMDQDIVAQVTGEKKPEEFCVEVPMFGMRELEIRCRIWLTVDIDAENRKFILQAKPNQLDEAAEDASQSLGNKLSDLLPEGTIVLAGSP